MLDNMGPIIMVCYSWLGVTQGDLLASLIFGIVYTHCVVEPTLKDHPDVSILMIYDDTYLAAMTPEPLIAANLTLVKNAATCLLEYVPRKEFIIQLPASPSRPAVHSLHTYRGQIHPKTEFEHTAIHVGGVPVLYRF